MSVPAAAEPRVWIGPAGWSYDDWKGRVYPTRAPKGFDPLAFLAQYFDVVEINTSFYQPPPRTWTRSWVRRIEHVPRFMFTAKLWRRFTHERETPPTADDVRVYREGIDVLAEEARLLAVLVQFPWSFRNAPDERAWLTRVAQTFGDYPLVLEVRHDSWDDEEALAWLRERGIALATIDQPLFEHSLPPLERRTAGIAYYRLHGRNFANWYAENRESHERYDYLYPKEELEPWAGRIEDAAGDPAVQAVIAITNNHYQGQAVVNALQLKSWSLGRKVPVPEAVRETFASHVAEIAESAEPPPQTTLFPEK